MRHRYLSPVLTATAVLTVPILSMPAQADDAASCATVRLSDPGWTDIQSTDATAALLLEGLGYTPEIKTLSVQIGFESMKNGEIDVFLGNWMPAQGHFVDDLTAANAVENLVQNLVGAKYTLAVPTYVADMGITDVADLAAHADDFEQAIYGIAPGSPGNENIQKMIDADEFGLGGWHVVESSEAGMLGQVARAERGDDAIVFLAWAPHPMNTRFDITYLTGADAYFGPNQGGADVFTLARAGFSEQCPNAAQFFSNLVFDIDMENEMMGLILDDGLDPGDAAAQWLAAHPEVLGPWLDGVTTLDGADGLAAVQGSLGL